MIHTCFVRVAYTFPPSIVGSHSLGMLRGNETGFNGSYSMKPETLSNNYYKEMLNSLNTWKQVRLQSEIDNQTKTRYWSII